MQPWESMFDLSGKVAVVTGGSRGLGREISLGFARAGADVVVASRDLGSCEKVVRQIVEQTGRRALAHSVHVGKWDGLGSLVDTAWDHMGGVDILVNNAGMSPLYDGPADIDESLFDKVIGVNLKGPFRLTALVGSRMVAESRAGSIINVSSVVAVRPRPDVLPYSAAKAGLNALTVGFAKTFGPSVRCNAIMPGAFLTDVSRAWDPDTFARRSATFALRRGGEATEIVGTAIYLASDASSYTTGSVITVDGGQ